MVSPFHSSRAPQIDFPLTSSSSVPIPHKQSLQDKLGLPRWRVSQATSAPRRLLLYKEARMTPSCSWTPTSPILSRTSFTASSTTVSQHPVLMLNSHTGSCWWQRIAHCARTWLVDAVNRGAAVHACSLPEIGADITRYRTEDRNNLRA